METITIMDEMLFQWQTEFLKIVSWTIILIFSNRKFRVIDNNGIVHKFVAVTNREETSANGYCKDVHHTNMLDGEFLTVVRHITEVATRRIILLFAIYFPSLFSPMSSIRDTYLDREINPLSKSLRALML